VAVRDELGALRQADELADLLRAQLEELGQLQVARARDVALLRVARVAGLAGVLVGGADVQERELR
jgi:hypothetical protein